MFLRNCNTDFDETIIKSADQNDGLLERDDGVNLTLLNYKWKYDNIL